MRKFSIIAFILCLCFSGGLFAQTAKVAVEGEVIKKTDQEVLGGVSIILDGPKKKILGFSDDKGHFSVSVPDNSDLIFMFVGYNDQKINIATGKSDLVVQMESSDNLMDEVVVRGYQKRSREVTTGASFIVTGKEIQDIPVSNAEQLLQGKVAGLNIQVNTGAPGYRGTAAIRGVSGIDVSGSGSSSFLSPTSPLYVIDGIPVEADADYSYGFNTSGPGVSPLSLIPPEDIQTIEVLKDAQATSLYGSRGAFGVILVTTRRGNSKIPRVRYTGNFFMNKPPKLRQTLGGNAERSAKIAEILAEGDYDDYLRISGTPILADSLNPYYNNSTNWQDVFYKTTGNQTHNLSIDGGNQKFNYKANFGYYSEDGIIANTGFKRYNTTLNMDYRPNDKLHVFVNLAGGVGKQLKGDGQGLFQTGVADNASVSSLLPGPSLFLASSGVISALQTDNKNLSQNLRVNAEISYLLLPGLNLSSNGSYDYTVGTEETFTPAAANSLVSTIYSYNDRNSTLYNRNGLTYSKSINKEHNFFFNAFNEIYVKKFQAGFIFQSGTPNDQFRGPLGFNNYSSKGGGVLNNYSEQHLSSFAGAFSYDYRKKYVLDLTYRLDASSVAGFDNPYAKNPSIGLRWNFNKEKLFEKLDWLTYSDIRMTWGRNIQPSGDIFSLYGTYTPNGYYIGSPRIGLNYDVVPNSTLAPTTNTTYNLGFDLGMFDSKFEVIFDTYYKKVDNLHRSVNLPTTSGFNTVLSDHAGLIDYGYELTLTARPLPASSKVTWSISVNGAINKDYLTLLPNNLNEIIDGSTVLKVGRNTLSNYLLKTIGVYASNDKVPVDPVTGLRYRSGSSGTAFFQEGDPFWQDLDGDYVLTDNDKQVLGNSQPVVTGGMNTFISYKNFSININGSFTLNRDIINDALAGRLRLVKDPYGSNTLLLLNDINYWKSAEVQASYPNPYDFKRADLINPFRSDQSLFQEDGSYFKINNITFAYSFEKSFAKRMHLNALRVYVSSNNVFTFSNYSGPNPENVTALGYDASGGYPVARTYNVGVNIEF